MYATRLPDCLLMVPLVGFNSPRRHLIMVLFPAPFGPTIATRESMETCTPTPYNCGLGVPGYWKCTEAIFNKAFPRLLTPSRGPGSGNTNLHFAEALISK